MSIKTIGAAVVGAAAIGLSVGSVQSAQAFSIFTDRTAWQNALGGATITTDTFDNDKPYAPTITFDSGVTSTGNGTGGGPNTVSSGSYRGTVDGQGDQPGVFDTITWGFSQPITAFGADWFETTGADDLTVSGNFDGTGIQTVNFLDYLGGSGTGFLGIIGSTSFSSITFGTQGAGSPGSIETFGADNLAFASGSTTPIPTPALLPGLIGMGIAAWRKRKGEQSETVAEPAEV